MKRITIFLLVLLMSSALLAQNEEFNPFVRRNELKINLPVAIFGLFPEISYERILYWGVSAGVTLGGQLWNDNYSMNMVFTPHVRWFFGGGRALRYKAASGTFFELNGSLFTRDAESGDYDMPGIGGEYSVYSTYTEEKQEFGAGIGLAMGWKYVTRNNWVGELFFGGGMDFLHTARAYPRLGISIGKRF